MKKHNVLLSTDIGTDIDDALALYLCMKSAEVSLRGVYVTNGNVDMRAKIARKMLRLGGYNAPVCIGEANPLSPEVPPYHTRFERMLLSQKEYEQPLESAGIEKDGLSHLEKTIEEVENPKIVSIAPLTNVAALFRKNPFLCKKVQRVYVMGGRENELEHNFRHDVLAAQSVLDLPLPIVIVPADTCDRFRIDSSYVTQLKGNRTKKYLSHMASVWKTAKEIEELRNERIEGQVGSLIDVLHQIEEANPRFELPQSVKHSLEALSNYTMFYKDYQKMFEFYKIFKGSIQHMDSPALRYIVGEFFKKIEKREFSISDAYAVYCLIHSDKTERKRTNIHVDEYGRMKSLSGNKHEIVTGIDYSHFKEFVKGGLR